MEKDKEVPVAKHRDVSRGFLHVQVFVVALLLAALSGVSEAFVNVAGGWQIVQSSPLAVSGGIFVQQNLNGKNLGLTSENMHYNYDWGSKVGDPDAL